MKKKLVVLLSALLCSSGASASARIFWSSVNVKGGDIGMVYGDSVTCDNVKISRLADTQSSETPYFVPMAKPDKAVSLYAGYANKTTASWNGSEQSDVAVIQGSDQGSDQDSDRSFKFEVPASFADGIYVLDVDGEREYINVPYIKWVHGDCGEYATKGGWLRLMGENLSNEINTPKVVLIDANGTQTALEVHEVYDVNSVEVKVPFSLAEGTYDVYLHNGYGDVTTWSMPSKIEIKSAVTKPTAVFNVKDFGAVGDGATDDTLAVRKAIDKARTNGGGTVYFPSGRYLFTGVFTVPQNTTIKGEGRELVSMVFLPFNWAVGNIPDAFFKGTKNFSIEDVTINASRMKKCITSEFESGNSENITIRNVNIWTNPYLFHGQTADAVATLSGELGDYTDKSMAAIYLGGDNITIEGCRVLGGKNSVMVFNSNGVVIRNSEIYNGHMGFYGVSGSQNVIIEDNIISGADLLATGGGIANYDSSLTQHVYYARNKLSKFFGNDREAMTTDGGQSAYYGTMSKISGTTITLKTSPDWGDDDWTGAGVLVLTGKGRGQYRLIKDFNANVIELDSPFEVKPGNLARITIVSMNHKGIYVNNTFEDTGVLQFYGVGIDNIVTGNEFTRSAGIKLNGMYTYGGYRPSWYNDISYNHFKEGYYTHWFGTNDGASGESSIWIYAAVNSQQAEQMIIAANVNGNVFDNHSGIKVTSRHGSTALTNDVIIQNNRIANADKGITINEKTEGIVLKNNSFENVTKEYDIDTRAEVEYR